MFHTALVLLVTMPVLGSLEGIHDTLLVTDGLHDDDDDIHTTCPHLILIQEYFAPDANLLNLLTSVTFCDVLKDLAAQKYTESAIRSRK